MPMCDIVSISLYSFTISVVQGRTNNLMHPAIAEICKLVFYGPGKLSSHCEEFLNEVPSRVVALVATVVCNVFEKKYAN